MIDDVKLDVALMDWIRVSATRDLTPSSFDPTDKEKRVDSKWLQYRGIDFDGVFYGHAVQDFQHYWMAQATGEKAHVKWLDIPRDVTAKRIDLQVTRAMPWNTIERIAQQFRRADWKGRRRKVQTITNDTFEDTCYIGVRTGGTFIRIYAKGNPGNMAVRFEAEFKKAHALGIWESLHDGIPMAQLLAQAIWQLPPVPDMKPFLKWAAEWESYDVRSIQVVPTKRRWIENTVIPALWKAANSHDDVSWLATELQAILDNIAQNLDK